MLTKVEKHDLEGVCRLCGMTLNDLFEETGIPVDELRRFADGEHPLKAGEREAILRVIFTYLPPQRPLTASIGDLVKMLDHSAALTTLFREVDEEEAESARLDT